MGWERKRGKLLDLNKFLLHQHDSFPLKAGPLEAPGTRPLRHHAGLRHAASSWHRRTHDRHNGPSAQSSHHQSETAHRHRWLRHSAAPRRRQRLLCSHARVSPPSTPVRPASTSTLAPSPTSTRISSAKAVFAGKGIYEVSILHEVLDRRFPAQRSPVSRPDRRLLRARRPRHRYRNHRRLPIALLRPHSPQAPLGPWRLADRADGSSAACPTSPANYVANPINTISRWKILDNLRRSLVEPVTFLLFLLGWFVLPGGALYWTIASLVLLLLPVFVQLAFNLGRAFLKLSFVGAREGVTTFASSFGFTHAESHLPAPPHASLARCDHPVIEPQLGLGKTSARVGDSGAGRIRRAQNTPWTSTCNSPPSSPSSLRLPSLSPTSARSIAAGPILLLWAFAPLVAIWLNSPPRQRRRPAHAARQTLPAAAGPPRLAILPGVWRRKKPLAHSRQRRRKGHSFRSGSCPPQISACSSTPARPRTSLASSPSPSSPEPPSAR